MTKKISSDDRRFGKPGSEYLELYLSLRSSQGQLIDSLDQTLPRIIKSIQENRMILEKHEIVLRAIADHLGISCECES